MNAIRDNKDRQEAAIYAFTIVTIIFLPISTVASVFGMNTNDVRNMGQSQWLFWAAALPLTTLVIAVSLFAAGIIPWPLWPLSWSDKAVLVRAQSEVSETKMLPEMRTSTGFTGARRRGTLGRRYSDAS
jgi:nucleoside recognition membrane protein YjiH